MWVQIYLNSSKMVFLNLLEDLKQIALFKNIVRKSKFSQLKCLIVKIEIYHSLDFIDMMKIRFLKIWSNSLILTKLNLHWNHRKLSQLMKLLIAINIQNRTIFYQFILQSLKKINFWNIGKRIFCQKFMILSKAH